MQTLSIALSFIVAASSAIGQSSQTEPVPAPAPTARFPAAWYQGNGRPGDTVSGTQAPITGAPYSATMVTTGTIPAQSGRPVISLSTRAMWYRDGMGRTRTEQPLDGAGATDNTQLTAGRKEIEVNDVVTHCMFHWGEPWASQGQAIAIVSCFASMYYIPWDTSWGVKAQTVSEAPKGDQTIRTEPLGHKTIDGWDVLGARSITMNSQPAKADQPAQSPQMVLERWWSPLLNETLWFGPIPPRYDVLPTFELKNIHAGEPDPALFYPPSNYQIVNQGNPHP
jgi:hypothetical protein